MQYLSTKEVQLELYKILCTFDVFCRQHDLRYVLEGGTLLGAARHKGFIPWDRDVDVSMPRPDYERLLGMKDALPQGYILVDDSSEPMPYPFAKLETTDVRVKEKLRPEGSDAFLWLDIFPWDGMPEGGYASSFHRRLKSLKLRSAWCVVDADIAYQGRAMKRLAAKAYRCLPLRALRTRRVKHALEKMIQRVSYDDSQWISLLSSPEDLRFVIPASEFDCITYLEFEGGEFPVFSNWEEHLVTLYGDWKTLPPVEERFDHHDFEAWL